VVYFIYVKLQHQWPYRIERDETLSEIVENIGNNN
jgi:hypothetical protein